MKSSSMKILRSASLVAMAASLLLPVASAQTIQACWQPIGWNSSGVTGMKSPACRYEM